MYVCIAPRTRIPRTTKILIHAESCMIRIRIRDTVCRESKMIWKGVTLQAWSWMRTGSEWGVEAAIASRSVCTHVLSTGFPLSNLKQLGTWFVQPGRFILFVLHSMHSASFFSWTLNSSPQHPLIISTISVRLWPFRTFFRNYRINSTLGYLLDIRRYI